MQEDIGSNKEGTGSIESFNSVVDILEVPTLEGLPFCALERDYLKVSLISNTIFQVIIWLSIISVIISIYGKLEKWQIIVGCISLCLLTAWSYFRRIKAFPFKAYAVRTKDIVYKSGWIWRQMTTIPFNRVQHVRIDQGPIERYMGLSKLKIYTAGGQNSDITIPGLRPDVADRIKSYIVQKTSESEEEE